MHCKLSQKHNTNSKVWKWHCYSMGLFFGTLHWERVHIIEEHLWYDLFAFMDSVGCYW